MESTAPFPQPDTTGVTVWGRATRFERGIYVNIWRWIKGNHDIGAPGTLAVPYVDVVRSTILLWIGASALEMVIVHFLVPWPWVRWTLLILSVWGLIWMFGYLGGLIVYPHLIDSERVRVRNGHTIDAQVPIDVIAGVRTGTKSPASSRVVSVDEEDPLHLYIAVSGQVNVHLDLNHPIHVQLPGGRYTVTTVSFWADDPRPAAHRLRELVESLN